MKNEDLRFIDIALEKKTVNRAIKVCLVVGTILNIINQGAVIFKADWQSISVFRMLLTYSVPYCVSTYSSAMARIKG
jgi:hypothetical protein